MIGRQEKLITVDFFSVVFEIQICIWDPCRPNPQTIFFMDDNFVVSQPGSYPTQVVSHPIGGDTQAVSDLRCGFHSAFVHQGINDSDSSVKSYHDDSQRHYNTHLNGIIL